MDYKKLFLAVVGALTIMLVGFGFVAGVFYLTIHVPYVIGPFAALAIFYFITRALYHSIGVEEQDQPANEEKIMNFFDAVGDCGFSQQDMLLLKNIWKEAGCAPPKSQVADASKMEQPEVDLDAIVNEAFDKYSSVDGYGQLSASFNRAELYSFIKEITRKEE